MERLCIDGMLCRRSSRKSNYSPTYAKPRGWGIFPTATSKHCAILDATYSPESRAGRGRCCVAVFPCNPASVTLRQNFMRKTCTW